MPDENPYQSPGVAPPPVPDDKPWPPGIAEIEYQLTLDDLVALSGYHVSHSRLQRTVVWATGLLLTTIATAAAILAWHKGATNLAIVDALVATFSLPGFFVFYRMLARFNARRLWKEGRNVGVLGPCRVVVEPIGLREVSDAGETLRRWHAVERVAATSNHLFVYVSALGAFIIPRRAFATPERCAQFLALVQGYAPHAVSNVSR